MISNQILQNTLEGIKNIVQLDSCICDSNGRIMVSTAPGTEKLEIYAREFAASQADFQSIGGYQYFKVTHDDRVEYVLVVEGTGENVFVVGRMASFQIQNLIVAYQEKFDKESFIKNLLLDNLLLVDIYNRAKKLKIDTSARRVSFIVETNANIEANVQEILTGELGSPKDFIAAVDEKMTVVVKDITEESSAKGLDAFAQKIIDVLSDAGVQKVSVAYGTPVSEIKEVSRSYKEAKLALDVGKIFYSEKNIIAYSSLGIGRLIYQLPIPLCRMFIKEIFDGKNPDEFDEETVTTINKFFENSLNVSETSRQLYIHRNTLVYRIDKLQKATGLDLRVFDDAITFKMALMVGKYMKYVEENNF